MPIPSPKKNQTQQEFIDSCASNPTMNKDYPDNKQRLAICYSQWEKAKKKKAKGDADTINFENQVINDFVILDND